MHDLIFVAFCGCCFVERRDYGVFGVSFRVYLAGQSCGEMAMRTGAVNAVLFEGCSGQAAVKEAA